MDDGEAVRPSALAPSSRPCEDDAASTGSRGGGGDVDGDCAGSQGEDTEAEADDADAEAEEWADNADDEESEEFHLRGTQAARPAATPASGAGADAANLPLPLAADDVPQHCDGRAPGRTFGHCLHSWPGGRWLGLCWLKVGDIA